MTLLSLGSSSHIGEVVESQSTAFVAQSLTPDLLTFPSVPALGSWIKSSDEETGNRIYGVVCYATIAPVDSIHRARALGLTSQELRDQQPQIFAMLKTDFRVAILGFTTQDRLYQYLPPRPPQIHQAVYTCTAEEIQLFCEHLEFLQTLLQVTGIPSDELVAAVLRICWKLMKHDRSWLVRAGQQLSLFLKDDYDRLRSIFRKVAF